MTDRTELPVNALLPDLLARLAQRNIVLLQAPPGAGKTTRVPPALLGAEWCGDRRILVLEPRRLAARAAARFMARERGEDVGATVGFRTRLETRVSAATRIEVVTEGILIRMLQRDPALEAVAAVVFDEFHERSLNADLGLALVRESQQALREDLRLVVMSATLDTGPLAALLDDAPVLSSAGRSFPVDVRYRPVRPEQRPADVVATAVRRALAEEPGSLLVFLPGMAEIRRVAERLGDPGTATDVHALHGSLPAAEQDAAIAPASPGRRKIVLATSIAETSLTIEGIRVVVDAGRERRARFDPGSGMTRLVTTRVSRAAADQRAGRAGRLEPGVGYRLWSDAEHKRLPAFTPPEILEADLAPLVLELAHWGTRDPGALDWLDPPPAAHWAQASALLEWLGALTRDGAITADGRAMLTTGLHPRLANMLVRGRRLGMAATAARLAALLSERDVLARDAGSDLADRLAVLDGARRAGVRRGALAAARTLVRRLAPGESDDGDADPGELLALAYPDRVARRRPGGPARFVLANGRGAWLPDDDPLAGAHWLVAADLDGQAREARIFLAAAVDRSDLERLLADRIETREVTGWDERRGTVVVRRQRRLGELVLAERDGDAPDAAQITAGLLDAVRRHGLDALNWTLPARGLQARVEFARSLDPDAWPAFDDASLAADLDEWLAPFLVGMTHWRDVRAMELVPALMHRLGRDRLRELDRLAPARLDVPAGRAVGIDYAAEGGPVLAVKLQAVFGWRDTPRVADGRVPVVLHLLDPAGRPLAVTSDLASFWANGYPDVARAMRGRYPKHPWPDDPATAEATMRTKRRT